MTRGSTTPWPGPDGQGDGRRGRVGRFFAALIDWSLALLGLLLILQALRFIDVAMAKYPVLAVGLVCMAVGLRGRLRVRRSGRGPAPGAGR